MLTIDGVDDADEMRLTDEAFDILGFTQVCTERHESIDLTGHSVGGKNEFIQMHFIYHAFW